MNQRIIGFDFARAIAIFGMVLVNYKVAMGAQTGSAWLLNFVSLFEGRASALFVVLAGIGISLMTAKTRISNDRELINKSRVSIIKRGLLLIVIGLLYTPVWPADILHFYGVYFLVASLLFMVSNKVLWGAIFTFMISFVFMMLGLNYEKGWDWTTLTYLDFWTMEGMFRHIFFNGFHPVFPWCTFLIIGMWLGRLDLRNTKIRKKLIGFSLAIFAGTEILSIYILNSLKSNLPQGMKIEEVEFLFSTSVIPPMPQYIIAAGSLAVLIITLSVYLTDQFSKSLFVELFYKTGQMSLTLYVAHVVLGMGILEAIDKLENQSIDFSFFSALSFCITGALFSYLWLKYFRSGPLEWIFRKVGTKNPS